MREPTKSPDASKPVDEKMTDKTNIGGGGAQETALARLFLQAGVLAAGQRDVAMGQSGTIVDGAGIGSYDGHKEA